MRAELARLFIKQALASIMDWRGSTSRYRRIRRLLHCAADCFVSWTCERRVTTATREKVMLRGSPFRVDLPTGGQRMGARTRLQPTAASWAGPNDIRHVAVAERH